MSANKTLPPAKNNATKNTVSTRPIFYHVSEVIYTARRMFALPIVVKNHYLPWGYDSILEQDGILYAIPNDEAFKILVQAKHLLYKSSFRKIGEWITQSLNAIDYNFSYVKNYNPHTGVSVQSVNRIFKYYRPDDRCMLELHDREEAYRFEIQSSGVDCPKFNKDSGIPNNTSS